MAKLFYPVLGALLLGSSAFAYEIGNITQIKYDLRGGENDSRNPTQYRYDYGHTSTKDKLYPATREGYSFLGWYIKETYPEVVYSNSVVESIYSGTYPSFYGSSGDSISLYARWGVVSKQPQLNADSCYLIHDAQELYGIVKLANDAYENYESKPLCISIEEDIVVNENVLAADGTPNEGEFFEWRPFTVLRGSIEGNGHVISGLYGYGGLVGHYGYEGCSLTIQNLGIEDSYFDGGASFVSSAYFADRLTRLTNVYSTATVKGAGGLVGYADFEGDNCPDVLLAPAISRKPSNEIEEWRYPLIIENSYYAGHLMNAGENSSGGLIGVSDNALVRNSFFAGTADVNDIPGIGNETVKTCTRVQDDDVISLNSFYLDVFSEDTYEATAASAKEFADGTVLAKLREGDGGIVWEQTIGEDVYPKIKSAFYKVSYELNGGENDVANQLYYKAGTGMELQPATKKGDVFEGWCTDSDCRHVLEKITPTRHGNLTLFAKWESGYSITYVGDDGAYRNGKNPSYRYADSSTFVLQNPTTAGKTFLGWYSDSTYENKVTELPTGNKDDVVLYAKWDKKMLRLTYDLNHGTMEGENQGTLFFGDTLILKEPSRDSSDFVGWVYEVKGKGWPYHIESPYVYQDEKLDSLSLHAMWTYTPIEPEVDEEGCLLITNPGELYYLSAATNDKLEFFVNVSCARIMNDIVVNSDLLSHSESENRVTAYEWYPLNLSGDFGGVVYGNGHSIVGLNSHYGKDDVYGGLVFNTTPSPKFHDLWIVDSYFDDYGKQGAKVEKFLVDTDKNRRSIQKKSTEFTGKSRYVPSVDAMGRNGSSRRKVPSYYWFY